MAEISQNAVSGKEKKLKKINNKEKTIQQQKGLPTLSADLNYLSVVNISLHNLGTFDTFVEPTLIIMISVRLERIYPCLSTYYNLI